MTEKYISLKYENRKKSFCCCLKYVMVSVMAGKTPIPVARAMRNIASNFDLARRQQRIPVDLLAERANLSVPTVRKLLNEGSGSLENFLRVARILGMLENVEKSTDPLQTPIGRIRAEQDVPQRIRRDANAI